MVQFAQHLKVNLDNNVSFMGWAGNELDEKNGGLGFHLLQFYFECFPLDAVTIRHHQFLKKNYKVKTVMVSQYTSQNLQFLLPVAFY